MMADIIDMATRPEMTETIAETTGAAKEIRALAKKVVGRAQQQNTTLFTAESCTGGMVAAALTAIPGASACCLGGIVAYSNAVKISVLGVPAAIIANHGAVSQPTARAMAEGGQKLSH
ncbi:MAG: CinA family protein, partial [Alphaproteobacteria bacterium]|nr:CinA family protein [Alphaproteobacteria bacterium]